MGEKEVKEVYVKPEVEVITFVIEESITTSGAMNYDELWINGIIE